MGAAAQKLPAIDRTFPQVRIDSIVGLDDDTVQFILDNMLRFSLEDHHKKIDQFSITCLDDDAKILDPAKLAFGAVLRVSFGYPYANELSPPRKFVIQRVKADLAQGKKGGVNRRRGFVVTLQGLGRAIELSRKSSGGVDWSRNFSNVMDVVRAIAKNYGFVESTMFLANPALAPPEAFSGSARARVQRAGESDHHFLKRTAAELGFVFKVDETGLHFHPPRDREGAVWTIDQDNESSGVLGLTIDGDVRVPIPRSMSLRSFDPVRRRFLEIELENSETGFFVKLVPSPDDKTAERKMVAVEEIRSLPLAKIAAEIERFMQRVRRAWKLTLRLVGDPRLRARQLISLTGFAPMVDDTWYVETATHTIDASQGYVTTLNLRRAPKKGAGKPPVWVEVNTGQPELRAFRVIYAP